MFVRRIGRITGNNADHFRTAVTAHVHKCRAVHGNAAVFHRFDTFDLAAAVAAHSNRSQACRRTADVSNSAVVVINAPNLAVAIADRSDIGRTLDLYLTGTLTISSIKMTIVQTDGITARTHNLQHSIAADSKCTYIIYDASSIASAGSRYHSVAADSCRHIRIALNACRSSLRTADCDLRTASDSSSTVPRTGQAQRVIFISSHFNHGIVGNSNIRVNIAVNTQAVLSAIIFFVFTGNRNSGTTELNRTTVRHYALGFPAAMLSISTYVSLIQTVNGHLSAALSLNTHSCHSAADIHPGSSVYSYRAAIIYNHPLSRIAVTIIITGAFDYSYIIIVTACCSDRN